MQRAAAPEGICDELSYLGNAVSMQPWIATRTLRPSVISLCSSITLARLGTDALDVESARVRLLRMAWKKGWDYPAYPRSV
jgi:hypothetical protein